MDTPGSGHHGRVGALDRSVIYLAGLQNIPRVLGSSDQDGASGWQKFWNITMPLLSPTTFFLFVTGLIGSLQTFTAGYIMAAAAGRSTLRCSTRYTCTSRGGNGSTWDMRRRSPGLSRS